MRKALRSIRIGKFVIAFIMGLGITLTSILGYATVTYVMNKTVSENVIVGETAIFTDGILIELVSFDNYTLTFFELEETATSKHYITYVYSYTILVAGLDIEVSNLSNDIVVSNLTSTETTISITFSLNQELEYVSGSIINVQFYFEAVETPSVNINDTTIEELVSIGFTESEAIEIVALQYNVSSLVELYNYIYIFDIIARFEHLVNDGTIVFE